MKIKYYLIILGVLVAGVIGFGIYQSQEPTAYYLPTATSTEVQAVSPVATPTNHIAPENLYPDENLTPGKVDTTDIKVLTDRYPCPKSLNKATCSYSEAFRYVPISEKDQVCKEYPKNCAVKHEIDHFIPIALGGSNDIKNLWAQPETNFWNGINYGFRQKDQLEVLLIAKVKVGELSPEDADICLVSDWIRCFQKYIKPENMGLINYSDGEDEVEN